MSRKEQIQKEVELVADLVAKKINPMLEESDIPEHRIRGLTHDRIYLSIFKSYKRPWTSPDDPIEVLIPELGHLSEGQIKDRAERAAEQGLLIRLKTYSNLVSFTTPEAKLRMEADQHEKKMKEEEFQERVERLRERTGLDIDFRKTTWHRGRPPSQDIELDLDEFEEFVNRVMS